MLATGKKLNILTNGRLINHIPTLLETFLGLAQLASSNPHILGIGTAQALGFRRFSFSFRGSYFSTRKKGRQGSEIVHVLLINKTTRIPTKQKKLGSLPSPRIMRFLSLFWYLRQWCPPSQTSASQNFCWCRWGAEQGSSVSRPGSMDPHWHKWNLPTRPLVIKCMHSKI